ncbi:hypothetical protein TNCV_494871 [Trichonephila clavipes]|nr:hypothetical protein TNCV_494871 [Trichonephila clavipes]
MFDIAAIGMYARTTLMLQGVMDMFENTGSFIDISSSDGYSCHQVHSRIDGCVVSSDSERSILKSSDALE